jgi:hypothetical protein
MKNFKPELFNPNDLCLHMMRTFEENRDVIDPDTGLKAKVIFCNEGGSRSGKTFSAYFTIIAYCAMNPNPKEPLLIYVVRKTLKSAREVAYQTDFKKALEALDIDDSKACATGEKSSPEYNLWGHTIKFRGLDNDEEFGRSDIVFVNEALDINSETALENLLLRCEKFAILDWNPKYTQHFIFDWSSRLNVFFTKTTIFDNKYAPESVKSKLLSTCPWDFVDFDFATCKWSVAEDFRKPNLKNIENKTANRWYWLVYGEGMRCPQDGAIFQNVEFIDQFPDDECERIVFGLDFGFTNDPTVITKVGWKGRDAYIEYLSYEPTPSAAHIVPIVETAFDDETNRRKEEAHGLEIELPYAWADSADRNTTGDHMVEALTHAGLRVIKARKMQKVPSIDIMKRYRLHVVTSGKLGEHARNEFIGYVTKVIEGRKTNIPEDGNDHGIDSARYVFMSEPGLRYNPLIYEKE